MIKTKIACPKGVISKYYYKTATQKVKPDFLFFRKLQAFIG